MIFHKRRWLNLIIVIYLLHIWLYSYPSQFPFENICVINGKTEMSIFPLHTHIISLRPPTEWSTEKRLINIYRLILRTSYHIFNNLAKFLNGYFAAKIGWGVLSRDLMDRECNSYLTSNINGNHAYEVKCRRKWVIFSLWKKIVLVSGVSFYYYYRVCVLILRRLTVPKKLLDFR